MGVLERPLRYLAIVCSLVVAAGFLMFAIDQTSEASQTSVAQISGSVVATTVDPDPEVEAAREALHGGGRELIDDVNDELLRPFTGITATTSNEWVRRGVPAGLALLVYGFGLGMLARYLAGR